MRLAAGRNLLMKKVLYLLDIRSKQKQKLSCVSLLLKKGCFSVLKLLKFRCIFAARLLKFHCMIAYLCELLFCRK